MRENDVIGRYAQLSLQADAYRAAGRPVPFGVAQALRGIETHARSMLSPEQFRAAQAHVESAKNQVLFDEQGRQRDHNEHQADKLMRDLTRGMLGRSDGLSPEEFARAREGKKVTFKSDREYFDPAVADRAIRNRTKHLDPAGKGFSFKEWQRRLDQLVDAGEEKFATLAQEYKGSPDELRKAVDAWGDERVGFSMRMRHASRTPPKDETVSVHDHDQRRAEVIGSYMEHVDKDDDQQMDTLFNGISSESMDDKGMRGDVARAFAEVEERNDGITE